MRTIYKLEYNNGMHPTMHVVNDNGDLLSKFAFASFAGKGIEDVKDLICKLLHKEHLRSSIKDVDIVITESKPEHPGIKPLLYFDMDGTLVDFQSGTDRLTEEQKASHPGHPEDVEGVFALMDPMPGAVEAVRKLSRYYDCHILSTAPWDNPSAWSDKLNWVKKYFGKNFYKKVTLTHHKELLNDGNTMLIDDRTAHGADAFGELLIPFDQKSNNWSDIAELLIYIAKHPIERPMKRKGYIKAIICKRLEDRRNIVQKEIIKQLKEGEVPTLALCSGDTTEWAKDFMFAAGLTLPYSDEQLCERLSEMSLYLYGDKVYDIGWIVWMVCRYIEDYGIKKIYVEDPRALTIQEPIDQLSIAWVGRRDIHHSIQAIEVLRRVVDMYGIELTLAIDNEEWFTKYWLQSERIFAWGDFGLLEFDNLVDELIINEE